MNKKRTVLITGAAGGIGKAVALKFAEKGYALALVARSKGVDLLKAELDQVTSDYTVFQGDLTDFDFVSGVVAKTVERWGRLDVLVNNAAWRTLVSMRTISLADWEKNDTCLFNGPGFSVSICCRSDGEARSPRCDHQYFECDGSACRRKFTSLRGL